MARQRSFLSLILVLLATFLISCGNPTTATAPPTYTTAQLEKIQEYVPNILAVRDRASELQQLIQTQQWIKVGNFIHGPMAEARLSMNYLSANLLERDQTAARKVARELFDDLVKIDSAADTANKISALNNSEKAFADIDKFLKLLPQTTSQSQAS